MAGNLGDLWFQLGVKDNTAPELNKILQTLTSVNGSVTKLNKDWYDAVGMVLKKQKELNTELSKESPNKDLIIGALREEIKQWQQKANAINKGTDNALRYFGMLQRVEGAMRKLDTLSSTAGKGTNFAELKEADAMLKNLRTQLWDIQHQMTKKGADNGLGGVDMSAWLSKYEKLMSNVFRDVNKRMNDFKKDNSLSDSASRAARLETALERIKQKLIEVRSLYSEAWRGGYDTHHLTAAQNYLNGLRRRAENLLTAPNGTADTAAFDKLFSDISLKIAKAATEIDLYTAAKKKAQSTTISNEQDKKTLDDTIERYAKLRSILSEGLKVRRGGNLSEEEVSRLNTALTSLVEKALELRAAVQNQKGATNLFDKGADKVAINDIKELIRWYEKLNRERAKPGKDERSVYVKGSSFDTAPIERQIAQYEKAVAVYERLAKITQELNAGATMGARQGGPLGKDYASLKQEADLLKATFAQLGNGLDFDRVKAEIQSLYALLEQFNTANANAKPLMSGNYSSFEEERERLRQQAAHQRKQQELEDAFRQQDIERKNAEANVQTARNAQQAIDKLQNERRQNQIRNLEQIEQKERELAELYSRLRASRDLGRQNGANVSDIERDLQMVRELYAEMQRLRRNVPTDKGFSPIGFSASEASAMERHVKGVSAEAQRIQNETRAATQATRDLASAFDRVHNSASKTSSVLSDIKSLFLQGGIVFAAQQLFNELVKTGGEIVQQHVALQTIVGDLQDANQLFGQIQDLALRSPFTFGQLNRDVKQLAAFGVETDKLYDKTRRIADISSGLGVSFERLGLAYGQVKARSWLDGKELRQFAYAGLPMLQKLADYYTKTRGGSYTTSQVRTMISKREVSFEDVDAIFNELTDKGGQFYNMQDKLSNTLLGRYMKLKDAWDIMMSGFADGQTLTGRFFSWILDRVTDLVRSLNSAGPVIAAFFSSFALNRAMGAFGGRWAKDLLAAKASLAAKLQEKALTEQLSAAEMRIVQTKGRITAEDLKNEAILSRINQQEARRLFISGQITKEQYKQLAASAVQRNNGTRDTLTAFFNAGNWGARGKAALGMGMSAITSLGKGLLGLIGGIPGLVITGVATISAYFIQKYREMTAAQKRAREELSNRGSQMKDFQKTYDVKKIVVQGEDAIDNAIETYKDKLKELAPYNYEAYLMTADEKASHEKRLEYLSQQLEIQKEANKYAQGNSDDFVEEYKDDFESFQKKFRDAVKAANNPQGNIIDPFTGSTEAQNKGNEVSGFMTTLANRIAKKFPDVAKSPQVREGVKQMMSELMAQLAFSPQEEFYFRLQLGKLLDFPDNENALADEARSRLQKLIQTATVTLGKGVEETGEQLAYKIRYGHKLTDAEQAKLQELYKTAQDQLIKDFPHLASQLVQLFANQKFTVDVYANFVGGPKPTNIEKDIMDNVNYVKEKAPVITMVRRWASMQPYEAQNTIQQEGDALYNEVLSARKNKKISNASRKEIDTKYSDFLRAVTLSGYKYTPTAKKSNRTPKNGDNKAEERYLRSIRKEEQTIQNYYDTWDKWRQVEGRDNAKTRVQNDKRFSEAFRKKYTDPEDLAGNYEKLATAIKQTTEERRQLAQEINSKAAEKEGEIELENAKKLVEVFKEQLDYLSKRYEIYERLLKVAGRETAGQMAFGEMPHSDSYYAYLKKRVEQLQGKGIKPFVENGDIATNIADTTVNAKASNVNFGEYGLEGALKMSYEEVKDKWGQPAADILKSLKEERDKLDAAIVDTLEKGYEYFEDYGIQIDGINKKYDEQIERLKERNKLDKVNHDYVSDDALKQRTTVINQTRNREVAATNYKRLQKSQTYSDFFGATFLLGSRRAKEFGNSIKDSLTEAFKAGGISAEEYAQKIEEVNNRMQNVENERSDGFTYFFGGGIDAVLQNRQAKGKSMYEQGTKDSKTYKEQYDQAKAIGDQEGMIKAGDAMNKANNMAEAGQSMMKGAGQAASAVAVIDKVVHGINDNVQKLKALLDDIAQSIEVFQGTEKAEDFKMSKGYTFVSGFASASQGATDAWDSLKSGNAMGVIEGGYRSIVGWAEPWAKRHDAKLEKQIQLAERSNKLISSMQSSIERNLSNTLGGVYGYQSKGKDAKQIKEGLDNYSLAKTGAKYGRNTVAQSAGMGALGGAAVGLGTTVGLAALGTASAGLGAGIGVGAALGTVAGPIGAAVGAVVGGVIGALLGHGKKKYKTNYSDDTYNSMVKANNTGAYYDQMYASYKMQRDNLNAQLEAEKDKKNSDKDKINDYEEKIDELDDKIQTFAKDMAKSLYEIDVKSWAKELTEAIVSAWAAGEDAVDAYKKKVKELMKQLAINIVTQKIMEKALTPVETLIEKRMDAKSGKLDENDIVDIADALNGTMDEVVPKIIELLEKMKSEGTDLSDENSSTMSSSIEGITETTADLLAAYLNAIRADVSIIRQYQGIYWPKLDITTQAQLQQLNMIAANTLRNADAAEAIQSSMSEVLSIMLASRNATRPLTVKVQ